jgi:hypothetical protein
MNRNLLKLLVLVVIVSGVVEAEEQSSKNELSLDVGLSFSWLSPKYGGPIDIRYARVMTDSLWFVVVPKFVLNLEAPQGTVMRGASFGLDFGFRWHFGHQDRIHIGLGGALGFRGYLLPVSGFGPCIRLDVSLYIPLDLSFYLILGGAAEGGVAQVGGDRTRLEHQLSGDILIGLAYRF